ncbi:MAG: N-acetylneuraminate synthase family protein [Nitrospira sp.]|nr:N-acetylneuraminate synthase family protein [Nitrospira sp.]
MNPLFHNLHIFEMANNHQGSVEHGLAIVKAMGTLAREFGIRAAVKLQYRDLDTFIHPDYLTEEGRKKVKHIERFLSTRLSKEQFRELLSAIRGESMLTVVTPFDETSVDWCVEHDVDIIKVASASADDWPLLEKIAEASKPVIASTGGQPFLAIDNLYSFLRHRKVDFALLHCVGIYPTPPELAQLNVIDRMRKRYPDIQIGYSGHEDPDDTDVVQIAIAKGARILERHVGVSTETINLNTYSMSPEQTRAWLIAALKAHTLCGDETIALGGSVLTSDKKVAESEAASLRDLARGVSALVPIKSGEEITREKIYFSFPRREGQLSSGEFAPGIIASTDYGINEPIGEKLSGSYVKLARTLIHDFHGMFNEAGVEIGRGRTIELSHHFGIEKFRETGALLVNVVNAHYCKKLVAQLPGQKHPIHKHQIKDEAFQVLWGDLQINLDGTVHDLKPGDIISVVHDTWHSFSTRGGVIFEEISTTAIPGDSFYQDEKIKALDPMQRKTVIQGW